MNAAHTAARGEFLFFVHADSTLDDPLLLYHALQTLSAACSHRDNVAGHFPLRFNRITAGNATAYRYAEEKTAFNRQHTVNGDQGLLISNRFFCTLGGFDESLPFLEDQRIAEQIRRHGSWITLPGCLGTSARRFETEGFHRRYILMSIMMGMYNIGMSSFFEQAPGVYRTQQETGTLLLSPFFSLLWRMVFTEWKWRGTVRVFYQLGSYIRSNSWQLFFFFDVLLRPFLGAGRYPCLDFHDRRVSRFMDNPAVDILSGIFCFIWFMTVLAPSFRFIEFISHLRRGTT